MFLIENQYLYQGLNKINILDHFFTPNKYYPFLLKGFYLVFERFLVSILSLIGEFMTEKELFQKLTTSEYTLWSYIRFWRSDISGSTKGIPSAETMADGMKVSKRTVYRLLDSLKRFNLI